MPHNYAIYHDVFIKSDSKTVFNAISQPNHLNNWWSLQSSGHPELDTEYNFYFTEEYNWYGKVITLIPNQSFHIKMTKADEDWMPTTFGFDLETIKNGVQLHFFHTGWLQCNHHFRRTSFCWAMLLNGLKDYIEKNIIIPFEGRE